jgi:hypothetical protein
MRALSSKSSAGLRRERYAAPGGSRRARARAVAIELAPQTVEQIAARVAALLRQQGSGNRPELLSAGELAHRLRVERPWVYRHRELLGGMRIGAGPKAPWRFDYEKAVEALRHHQPQTPAPSPETRRSR